MNYGYLTITAFALFGLVSLVHVFTSLVKPKLVSFKLAIVGWFIYTLGAFGLIQLFTNSYQEQVSISLIQSAKHFASTFEVLGHHILAKDASEVDPTYLELIELEKSWLRSQTQVADIYTMKRSVANEVYLVVDSETDYNQNGIIDEDREFRTPIGEIYDKSLPELFSAFAGNVAFTQNPYLDKWGYWISVFIPLRTPSGDIDGILGVDYYAEEYAKGIFKVSSTYGTLMLVLFVLICLMIKVQMRNVIANRDLISALDLAQKSKNVKTQFLSNMSHEIRTPINGIIGPAHLLADEGLVSVDGLPLLKMIISSSNQLSELVNDILDFSKLEARAVNLEALPINFRDLVETTLDVVRFKAKEKGLALQLIDHTQGREVFGDPNRIKQVLLNLLSNAVKFTDTGEVVVLVEYKKIPVLIKSSEVSLQSPPGNFLSVYVKDTGCGISEENHKKLFLDFSQVDASTTRNFGGTGLGLAISKSLVELMGGQIKVESKVKVGTTFHFEIPAPLVVVSEPQNVKKDELDHSQLVFFRTQTNLSFDSNGHKPFVLVVDDVSINRLTLVKVLQNLGVRAIEVSSGSEAIQVITSQLEPVDLVFMDLMMPQMDGFETSSQLRSMGVKTPIVCCSATYDSEIEKKCIDLNIEAFIGKPYRKQTILKVLNQILHWEIQTQKVGS
jgi:signal transduction histidine kinase